MRMRDGRDGTDLLVVHLREGKRKDAHERAIAVVELARTASAFIECVSCRVTDIEEPIYRIGPFPIPLDEAPPHILDIDRPVSRMLSQVASAIEVSSLQVPAGW